MYDDEQILRPKATETILYGIGCLVFTLGGIFIKDDKRNIGWVIASFFGLGFIVFIIQLIPGSTQLTLKKDGFIMTSFFRSHFTKWSEVKVFKIGYLGRKQAVMFDYNENHTNHKIGKKIAKSISNSHAALPNNYGLNVTDLLELMNKWKNKNDIS